MRSSDGRKCESTFDTVGSWTATCRPLPATDAHARMTARRPRSARPRTRRAPRSWPGSTPRGPRTTGRTCDGCSGSRGTTPRRRAGLHRETGCARSERPACASLPRTLAQPGRSATATPRRRRGRRATPSSASRPATAPATRSASSSSPRGMDLRVDRDERSGQRAFAEQILEQVRDLEPGVERVGRVRGEAEVVREHADPDQAEDPADEDPDGDEQRPGPARACRGGGGLCHGKVDPTRNPASRCSARMGRSSPAAVTRSRSPPPARESPPFGRPSPRPPTPPPSARPTRSGP